MKLQNCSDEANCIDINCHSLICLFSFSGWGCREGATVFGGLNSFISLSSVIAICVWSELHACRMPLEFFEMYRTCKCEMPCKYLFRLPLLQLSRGSRPLITSCFSSPLLFSGLGWAAYQQIMKLIGWVFFESFNEFLMTVCASDDRDQAISPS